MPRSRTSRSASPLTQRPTDTPISSEQQQIFQNVKEIFQSTLDEDIVRLVLMECNWRDEVAIDKLLAIAEDAEAQKHYKQKQSQLHKIAEGVLGPISFEDYKRHGSVRAAVIPDSKLSATERIIGRPVKHEDRSGDSNPTVPGTQDLLVPRGSSNYSKPHLSPKSDSIDIDFPKLPSKPSGPPSAFSSESPQQQQQQASKFPGPLFRDSSFISQAQSAYNQQYDDAASAQRWEQVKEKLSQHYVGNLENIKPGSNSPGLNVSTVEKRDGLSEQRIKTPSVQDTQGGNVTPLVGLAPDTSRPKTGRNFPVRLLNKDNDEEGARERARKLSRLDSADLDENILRGIYEYPLGCSQLSLSSERIDEEPVRDKKAGSGAGTPRSVTPGHSTPPPSNIPMTLPVIGLSVEAEEFVPRPKPSKIDSDSAVTSEPSQSSPKDVSTKTTRSNPIEIKSGARNVKASHSPGIPFGSPVHASPTVSPGMGQHLQGRSPPVSSVSTAHLTGSPVFVTYKWPNGLQSYSVSATPAHQTPLLTAPRYIAAQPPQAHLTHPQAFRLHGGPSPIPFPGGRMMYPMPQSPFFRMAGVPAPRMAPMRPAHVHMQRHPTDLEERAAIATGSPIMATATTESQRTAQQSSAQGVKLVNPSWISQWQQKIKDQQKAGKKVLVIVRGLPGSGKSTLSRSIQMDGVVLSTDDFFLKGGFYTYNPDKLSESHQWNRERAKEALKMGTTPIIIDNTNTQKWEFISYVNMAISNNYHVEIIEPDTPWKFKPHELAKRTVHGVPKDHIQRMMSRYEHNVTVDTIVGKSKPNNTSDKKGNQAKKPKEENVDSCVKVVEEIDAGNVKHKNNRTWDLNEEKAAHLSRHRNNSSRNSSMDRSSDTSLPRASPAPDINSRSESPATTDNEEPPDSSKGVQSNHPHCEDSPDQIGITVNVPSNNEPPPCHTLQASSPIEITVNDDKNEVPEQDVNKRKKTQRNNDNYQKKLSSISTRLSDDTLREVNEMLDVYMKDTNLSKDELQKREEELGALLQLLPIDDKEMNAAEQLIHLRLHNSNLEDGDDASGDESMEAENSVQIKQSEDSEIIEKIDIDKAQNNVSTFEAKHESLIESENMKEVVELDDIVGNDIGDAQVIDTEVLKTELFIESKETEDVVQLVDKLDSSNTDIIIVDSALHQTNEELQKAESNVEEGIDTNDTDTGKIDTSKAENELAVKSEHESDMDEMNKVPDNELSPEDLPVETSTAIKEIGVNKHVTSDQGLIEDTSCSDSIINVDLNCVNKPPVLTKPSDIELEYWNKVDKEVGKHAEIVDTKWTDTADTTDDWVEVTEKGECVMLSVEESAKPQRERKQKHVNNKTGSTNDKTSDTICEGENEIKSAEKEFKLAQNQIEENQNINSSNNIENNTSENGDKDDPIINDKVQPVIVQPEPITSMENTSKTTSMEKLEESITVKTIVEKDLAENRHEDVNCDTVDQEANETCSQTDASLNSSNKISCADTTSALIDHVTVPSVHNNSLNLLKDVYADMDVVDIDSVPAQDDKILSSQSDPAIKVTSQTSDESVKVKGDSNTDTEPSGSPNVLEKATVQESKVEESSAQISSTHKPKKKTHRKIAAIFPEPLLTNEEKKKLLSTDWTSLNVSTSVTNMQPKVSSDVMVPRLTSSGVPELVDLGTMTSDEDFQEVFNLSRGGFVSSSLKYLIGTSKKIINADHPISTESPVITKVYLIDKSTSIDDLKDMSYSESVRFLKTCFPNVREDELECVLVNCHDNVEWAINLLLDWKYSMHLSEEEKQGFEEGIEKVKQAAEPVKQPSSLTDLCFGLIEQEKIATRDELEEQLIETSKGRLDRIEDENITKIRLRRSSSLNESLDDSRDSSSNTNKLSPTAIARSLSAPSQCDQNLSVLMETVDEQEKADKETECVDDVDQSGGDLCIGNKVEDNIVDGVDDSVEDVVNKLDESVFVNNGLDNETGSENDIKLGLRDRKMEKIRHKVEMKETVQALARETDSSETTLEGDGVVDELDVDMGKPALTIHLPRDTVLQLEKMFGPIGSGTDVSDIPVPVDHGTALKLYQCIKHGVNYRKHLQLLKDEEMARRLQEQEDSFANNQRDDNSRMRPNGRQRRYVPLDERLTKVRTQEPQGPGPVQLPVKSFESIMQEEEEEQKKKQEFKKLLEAEGGPSNLSTRVKRLQLYEKFPTVDRSAIDRCFEANCFNMTETVEAIQWSLGHTDERSRSGNVDSDLDTPLIESTKQQSIQEMLDSYLYTPHVTKDFQDGAYPNYEDYRGEANLHIRLRHECFQKAQAAFRQGLKQVASFYSQQGHLHTQKIKEANMRASEQILADRNGDLKNGMLDLHGLHIDEAIAALNRTLPDLERDRNKKHIVIITGRGSHSKGGIARLRPSVIAYLKRFQYSFVEEQTGVLKVTLKYRRSDK